MTGLEIYYADENYEYHLFTGEYSVKLFNEYSNEYEAADSELQAGKYSVFFTYNDGSFDWETGFILLLALQISVTFIILNQKTEFLSVVLREKIRSLIPVIQNTTMMLLTKPSILSRLILFMSLLTAQKQM